MDDINSKKISVLLVEDNETFRKVVKTAMQIEGLTVFEAENGETALKLARENKPDIILADIQMPVMDGLTMLKTLKTDEQLKNIPVVMLTNYQEELGTAVDQGADESYLKTSLTPHQLIEVCRKRLESPVASVDS